MDGIVFEEPVPDLFSFNNPFGACPTCEGFSLVLGIDEDLVIPDKRLSVYEGAVAPGKVKNWANGGSILYVPLKAQTSPFINQLSI